MRRWLTVFLLILLPLQLSWAVAATYCAHEADPAASHVGHHQHRHEADPAGPADVADAADPAGHASPDLKAKADDASSVERKGGETAADKALTCVDDDCSFCHLGHTQPVASTPLVLPAMAGPADTGSATDAWTSRGPDRRERPNWRAA